MPEARLESGPYNALYAYGQAHAFGFSPFAIDNLAPPEKSDQPKPGMMQTYALLNSLSDLLPPAQAGGLMRGLVLHRTSPRPSETVALGGYLFEAELSRSWPAREILAEDGAMMVMEASPGEFYILGSGLTIGFARDPDVDSGTAGIESVEEVSRPSGEWKIERRLMETRPIRAAIATRRSSAAYLSSAVIPYGRGIAALFMGLRDNSQSIGYAESGCVSGPSVAEC